MNEDERALDLLAVLHFVLAGLTVLIGLIPVIHVILGALMVTGRLQDSAPPPPWVGWAFIGMGIVFILFAWVMAGLTAACGYMLKRRRARTFCVVAAAIECLNMPFGTVLGILTLIALNRLSVIGLFENATPPPA